jgi:hypothetical protein
MKKLISLKDIAAVLLIFIVVGAFFFRLFYPNSQIIATPDFGESDAIGNLSSKTIYTEGLKDHRIILWSSRMGGGYPVYSTGILGALYLPNLIAFSVFPFITAYNLVIVGSVFLLGLGTYLWLRILRYQGGIALFGTLTLMLSGYVIAQLTHISITESLPLFPIICSLFYLLAKRKSWLIVGILVFVLSQQIFIGSPQIVLLTILFAGLFFLYSLHDDPHWGKAIVMCIVTGILTLGISAIQLLPSAEYQSKVNTAGGFSLNDATYFSFPPEHLFTLMDPFALGNPKTGTYPSFTDFNGSIFWENTIFIGIAPLLILGWIALTLIKRQKNKQKRWYFFAATAFVSYLLMTGKYSPLYLLYSFWPFSLFRAPSRFVWLFIVSLTFLSIEALQTVIVKYVKPNNQRLTIATCIITQIIICFGTWYTYHAIIPAASWLSPPSLLPYVTKNENVLAIGAGELHNQTFLTRGWQSARDYINERNTFTPDTAALWGINQFEDQVGRQLARNDIIDSMLKQNIQEDTKTATISALGQKLLSLYAIKTITSVKQLTAPEIVKQARIVFNNKFIDIYTNPSSLPIMYLTTSVLSADTAESALSVLQSEAFTPGKSVLRENVHPYEVTTSATPVVTIQNVQNGEYISHVSHAPNRSVLVLAQTYYPGWKAIVDGHLQITFPVNIRQIGTELNGGNHTVQFIFEPDSFRLGALISAVSLLVTVCVMGFGRFLPL